MTPDDACVNRTIEVVYFCQNRLLFHWQGIYDLAKATIGA